MKPQRNLAMAKLSTAARDFVIFMPCRKLTALGIGSAVAAKCRALWGVLTRGAGASAAVPRPAADDDDYFRWSYEFSCANTPVVDPVSGRGCGHRRRRRLLPPCVGAKQAREMLAASIMPRDEVWPAMTPEPSRSPVAGASHEIDGRAEEFIRRFHEQLRMQGAAEPELQAVGCETRLPAIDSVSLGALCGSDASDRHRNSR
ncbi:hypothetical protein ACP4OV_005792 [Aristida adscensionis]